jgi:hypothetical protein
MSYRDGGYNVVHHVRICRSLARGFDQRDVPIYAERHVRHALGGRGYHMAVAAGIRITPQLADGKIDA